jgi:signal transduction histidine kinase
LSRLNADLLFFDCDRHLQEIIDFLGLQQQTLTPLPLIALVDPKYQEQTLPVLAEYSVFDYIVIDQANHYFHLLPRLFVQVRRRHMLTIENEETLRALQQRNRDLTLLTRVGQELSATHDATYIVERVLRAVTETIGSEGASIWLWDEDKSRPLICESVFHKVYEQKLLKLEIPPGQGVVGWVAQNGVSAIVNSTANDVRFTPKIDEISGFQTNNILAVPLILRDTVIGVLEIVNKLDGDFDDKDCALIETLAGSAAIAIDNARLVKMLRENTAELERKNEELDAFAHTVAHDLKNPLGLMMGTAQVLMGDYSVLDYDTIHHHLSVIIRNGRRASTLIEALLLLAEIQDTEIVLEPLEMGEIVREVRRRLADGYDLSNVEITMPMEWPLVWGYTPWVEDVWLNLLSNGLKYGGIPPRLELGFAHVDNDQIRFWVKDNGDGLSQEQQVVVFQPFKRFHYKRATGHGLGLSIVRRIIEKLGGQVSVESPAQPGEGAVFSFTLPLFQPNLSDHSLRE